MLLHEPLPYERSIGVIVRLRQWWQSLDKPLFYCIGALMFIGIMLTAAAGPVAAMRKDIANPLHFVERQYIFYVPAFALFILSSMLSLVRVRRAGIVLCAFALVGIALTLLIGEEVKGSTRWLSIAGVSLQPSELFKPGFIITAAWLLAESHRDARFPGGIISFGLFGLSSLMFLMQPDYGQLMLLVAVWGVMFFLAGWSWAWVMGLGAGASGLLMFGYHFAPHVKSRIDRFLAPETGDTYQVDQSLETLSGGGLLGHDLNNVPSSKESLPDAHTDFIFAVAGEEFGFILCLLILGLFATIALRSLLYAGRCQSIFLRCAIAGLGSILAFQAIVNIGVSLAVLPAKGMTLPFISYGGSSLWSSAITAGLLLALTRNQEGSYS